MQVVAVDISLLLDPRAGAMPPGGRTDLFAQILAGPAPDAGVFAMPAAAPAPAPLTEAPALASLVSVPSTALPETAPIVPTLPETPRPIPAAVNAAPIASVDIDATPRAAATPQPNPEAPPIVPAHAPAANIAPRSAPRSTHEADARHAAGLKTAAHETVAMVPAIPDLPAGDDAAAPVSRAAAMEPTPFPEAEIRESELATAPVPSTPPTLPPPTPPTPYPAIAAPGATALQAAMSGSSGETSLAAPATAASTPPPHHMRNAPPAAARPAASSPSTGAEASAERDKLAAFAEALDGARGNGVDESPPHDRVLVENRATSADAKPIGSQAAEPPAIATRPAESRVESPHVDRTERTHAEARPAREPHVAPNQVGVHLTRAAVAGADRLTLHLVPAELGRIEIQLTVGDDKSTEAVIRADHPQTLDLLQREARGLERALEAAGLRTEAGGLDFGLRGEDRRDGAHSPDRDAAGGGRDEMAPASPEPASDRAGRGILDLTI